MGPRERNDAPSVPVTVEVSNSGSRAQHSSAERPWCAVMTVTFSVLPRGGSVDEVEGDLAAMRGAVVSRRGRRVERCIFLVFMGRGCILLEYVVKKRKGKNEISDGRYLEVTHSVVTIEIIKNWNSKLLMYICTSEP